MAKSPSPSTADYLQPWFKEGNVILVADEKCFRVHRDILSSYSHIFEDMFLCPQPSGAGSDTEESIDGCPVVRLPDAASHVQIALQAMYDRGYMNGFTYPMPFSVLTAFLRLGEKYEIKTLYNEAKARLAKCYPSSVTDLTSAKESMKNSLTGSDPHHFRVINVAREVGLLSVLPAAMYLCLLECPPQTISDGYETSDGHCSLSPANQSVCIAVQDSLASLRRQSFQWLGASQFARLQSHRSTRNACSDKPECLSGAHTILTELFFRTSLVDPLADWREDWDEHFCDNCSVVARRQYGEARVALWASLPRIFGLGQSWTELEQNERKFDLEIDSSDT
ncbi:hypothetical protein V8B97DRAFT_1107250 [Scleroderma yunnanense]